VLNVRFKKKNPCYSIIARVFMQGDPEAVRTPDPQLRRLLLYPTELPDQKWLITDHSCFYVTIGIALKSELSSKRVQRYKKVSETSLALINQPVGIVLKKVVFIFLSNGYFSGL
jgi:hypothetical protein